jgi:electron transport complex protein RnfE
LLFGAGAKAWEMTVFTDYPGFLVAILPPGAFLFTGLLIALKNIIDGMLKAREERLKAPVIAGSKRARVTGKIS